MKTLTLSDPSGRIKCTVENTDTSRTKECGLIMSDAARYYHSLTNDTIPLPDIFVVNGLPKDVHGTIFHKHGAIVVSDKAPQLRDKEIVAHELFHWIQFIRKGIVDGGYFVEAGAYIFGAFFDLLNKNRQDSLWDLLRIMAGNNNRKEVVDTIGALNDFMLLYIKNNAAQSILKEGASLRHRALLPDIQVMQIDSIIAVCIATTVHVKNNLDQKKTIKALLAHPNNVRKNLHSLIREDRKGELAKQIESLLPDLRKGS